MTRIAGSTLAILKVVEQEVENAATKAECWCGSSTLVLKELSWKLHAMHSKSVGHLELVAAAEGWSQEKNEEIFLAIITNQQKQALKLVATKQLEV